jgi:UDP-2,3-diacylglucosamine hydrolase
MRKKMSPEHRKNIYFVSDLHLGFPDYEKSLIREKLFVQWMDEIKHHAKALFLVGDIFDFWWEWKYVCPRGFVRFLGKLAEFHDMYNIPVHFFIGNHDIWIFDYLPAETGIILHKKPLETEIDGKKFFISHGDGLGPYDKGYRILNKIFNCKFLQWWFSRLHPNFAFSMAYAWSRSNRKKHANPQFMGEEKEWLILYSKSLLETKNIDFFIYGHRHIPVDVKIGAFSRYINLGDWLENFTYGVFDGINFTLKHYKPGLSNE